jgi:hypothetical protein
MAPNYWANTAEYINSEESFDVIQLHSLELHHIIEQASDTIKNIQQLKLTKDQEFLCKAQGTKMAVLLVVTKDEHKPFAKLLLDPPYDDEEIEKHTCRNSNGSMIYPKLIVHMSLYFNVFI